MKKIKLIILVVFLLISGCTKEKVVEEHKEPIVKEEVKDTYIDNNPIKLGIFLSNNNYYNKEVIEDTHYTNLTNGVDIGSFEVFLTDDKTINGTKFKDTWQNYYDKYEDINLTISYAKLEDKKIVPTDKGIQLSNFLDRSFSGIINLNYTRDMEECLDDIANGDLTRVDFLQTAYNNIEEAIKNNKENCSEMDDTKTCPNCGGKMVIRRSRFGKLFYGCASYPECHGIINID